MSVCVLPSISNLVQYRQELYMKAYAPGSVLNAITFNGVCDNYICRHPLTLVVSLKCNRFVRSGQNILVECDLAEQNVPVCPNCKVRKERFHLVVGFLPKKPINSLK